MKSYVDLLADELDFATNKFPAFASYHEGYAILLEEVDELWDEVKKKQPQDANKIRKEAIQVAAMAIRLCIDCCDKEKNKSENN